VVIFGIIFYGKANTACSECDLTFLQLVERCVGQLEGAFAIVVKSRLYPNELIATRRSSPLLIGINSTSKLNTDHIPILYSKGIYEILLVFYLSGFCSIRFE